MSFDDFECEYFKCGTFQFANYLWSFVKVKLMLYRIQVKTLAYARLITPELKYKDLRGVWLKFFNRNGTEKY